MKISLNVHGQEMSFTKAELAAIVEAYFNMRDEEQCGIRQFSETPCEGKWFLVEPQKIDQSLFNDARADENQETTRRKILWAFREMAKNDKYSEPFKTTFPFRSWRRNETKEIRELMIMARLIGEEAADEIEQALEWAQRISNGETWESICNKPDEEHSYRVVKCKYDGIFKLVGGSSEAKSKVSATHVLEEPYTSIDRIACTVPLIISHKI